MKNTILIFVLYLTFTVNAHAYLDPGTGSMILQLILGGIAAFFVAVNGFFFKAKNYIKKILNLKNNKNINK